MVIINHQKDESERFIQSADIVDENVLGKSKRHYIQGNHR